MFKIYKEKGIGSLLLRNIVMSIVENDNFLGQGESILRMKRDVLILTVYKRILDIRPLVVSFLFLFF